jgi:hypothetical protein
VAGSLSAEAVLLQFKHRYDLRLHGALKPEFEPETGMHLGPVVDAAVSRAETFAVTVGADRTARVWAVDDGRPLALLRLPRNGNDGEVNAVAISPDGSAVALGGWDTKVFIYRSSDWTLMKETPPFHSSIMSLRYAPDGKRLAVGLWSHAGLRVLETEGYAVVFEDREYTADCYGLSFDEAGDLAVACWDQSIRLYSPDHQRLKREPFFRRPQTVAFSPDGQTLAVGIGDAPLVMLLSIPELTLAKTLSATGGLTNSRLSLGQVTWSKDGAHVVASGRFGSVGAIPILRWSRDGTAEVPWSLNQNTTSHLAALGEGRLFVAAQDPVLAVLNADGTARWIRRSSGPNFVNQQRSVRISGDGATVGFGWEPKDPVRMSISLREQRFLAANELVPLRSTFSERPDFPLRGWENGTRPTLDGRALPIQRFETCRSVASDRAETRFLLGAEWNAYLFRRSGQAQWKIHLTAAARAVALSDDGHFAVIAGVDGIVRWFDAQTGAERLALVVVDKGERWLAWTPDGFFSSSPGAENLLVLRTRAADGATKSIPMTQFADLMRRPDIIRGLFGPPGR